ncbi:hypothetical protein PPTG_20336, partial [Phytophthora nicotianae INRA-310]
IIIIRHDDADRIVVHCAVNSDGDGSGAGADGREAGYTGRGLCSAFADRAQLRVPFALQ